MNKNLLTIGILSVILFIACALGFTQEYPPRTMYAHYLGDLEGLEPPIIDGLFEEDGWQAAGGGRGPTIKNDGLQNCIVKIRPELPLDDPLQSGSLDGDAPADEGDLSFLVWTMYDDTYFYVAVAVRDFDLVTHLGSAEEDGETWNEDSVEIFIDGNHNAVQENVNDHPEEYATGGQFVFTAGGAHRDKEAGDPTFGDGPDSDWYAAAYDNDDFTGINYEFRIKRSKIGNPQRGDVIGFNVAVNDADDFSSPTSQRQLRWVGEAHDENTYGDLVIGRREITAFFISETITIDGKLDEPSWNHAEKSLISLYTSWVRLSNYISLEDCSCNVRALHDTTHMYFGYEIRDDMIRADTGEPGGVGGNIWLDDAIELEIDGDISRNLTNETMWGIWGLSAKLMVSANSHVLFAEDQFSYGENLDQDDWYALATETENGYTIECRVKKESVMPDPENQTQTGVLFAVDDDDKDAVEGDRDDQIRWDGTPNFEYTYGILNLGGPSTMVHGWELF